MMISKTKQPTPRLRLAAYFRLQKLTAAIQRGRYPNKQELARLMEYTPRTVQRDLRALEGEFNAPLAFDRAQNGFYFTDPEWRLPAVQLSEGELISFFAAERFMRRLGAATAEIRLARDAVRSLAALLPSEVHIDLGALEDAISFAPDPGRTPPPPPCANWPTPPCIARHSKSATARKPAVATPNAAWTCCCCTTTWANGTPSVTTT